MSKSNAVSSNAVVLIEERNLNITTIAILANAAVIIDTIKSNDVYGCSHKTKYMPIKEFLKIIDTDSDLKNVKQVVKNVLKGNYTLDNADNADDATYIITVNKNGFKDYRNNKPVKSARFDDTDYIHLHDYIFNLLITFDLRMDFDNDNEELEHPMTLEELIDKSDSFMSYIKAYFNSSFLNDSERQDFIYDIGVDIKNSNELLATIKSFVIKRNCPELAYWYCKEMDDDFKVRQIIIDAGKPQWAYWYCNEVSNDVKVRQVIIDSGSPHWAELYCCNIRNDDDMKQVIIDSGDADYAKRYCVDVANDNDMKELVLASKNPELILDYQMRFKDKESFDVFKSLVSKTPELALRYCMSVSTSDEYINELAKQHALNSKDNYDIFKIGRLFGFDDQVIEAITELKDRFAMAESILRHIKSDDFNINDKGMPKLFELAQEIGYKKYLGYRHDTNYLERLWSLNQFKQSNIEFIVQSGDAELAMDFCVCRQEDIEELRVMVVDAANTRIASFYCAKVAAHDDLKQIIIDSGDPKWACMNCRSTKDPVFHQNLRQVILDAKDPYWALEYCRRFGKDDDMRQVIGDSRYARDYNRYVRKAEIV